ncbi:MAG: acyl-CoA thioesterase [Rhodobacter sp.]|nr:acyl-CoA thioesterase [Rhodobacter sp.]
MRPQPDPRGDYSHFEPLQMRWADTDIYGHMNNAVHYTLFDTAVQAFLVREGLLDLGASETVFLVVSTACDHFEEITFGDQLEAGLKITDLGNSSVRYRISIFRNAGATAAATGSFTHVNVTRTTRRPAPLVARARAILENLA